MYKIKEWCSSLFAFFVLCFFLIEMASVNAISTLGEQKTLAVINDASPSALADAKNLIDKTNNFWREASYGKLWLNVTYAQYNCTAGKQYKEDYDLRKYSRIFYEDCSGYNYISSVGKIVVSSKYGDGFASFGAPGGHEGGHGLGLLHGHFYECPYPPFGGSCRNPDYSDPFDQMGIKGNLFNPPWYHYNALHKDQIGWLDPTQIVTAATSGRFVLTPFETTTPGLKALRVPSRVLGERFIYVEYRQPIGSDSTMGCTNKGAMLHIGMGEETLTRLIDANSGDFCDQLLPGHTLVDPSTGNSITVVSASSTNLVVDVSLNQSAIPAVITHLIMPTFQPDYVTGLIPVEAEAASSSGIAKVEFYYSDKSDTVKFATVTSAPYKAILDSEQIRVPPRFYPALKIWAVATDNAGNQAKTEIAGQLKVYYINAVTRRDNFDRTASTTIGDGWSEAAGDFIINGAQLSNNAKGTNIVIQPDLRGSYQTLGADFTSVDNIANPRFGFVMRYQDPLNYYLLFRNGKGHLIIEKVTNGVEKILSSSPFDVPDVGLPFHVEASALNNNLSLFIGYTDIIGLWDVPPEESFVITREISVLDSSYLEGTAGIYLFNPTLGRSYLIDNFKGMADNPNTNCIHNNPGISISPSEQSGAPGDTLTYSLSIYNRDLNCAPSTITVTPTLPSGWMQTPTSLSENLAAGQSVLKAVAITSSSNTLGGPYSFTESVANTGISLTSAASSIYTVIQPNVTNSEPLVNAGPDLTINLNQTAQLMGDATDDGLPNPSIALSTLWTKVSGPGNVVFGDATSKITSATFSNVGVYVLRLIANDGQLSASDDATVNVLGIQSTFSDDFNRPDSDIIGGSWSNVQGDYSISGSQLRSNSSKGENILVNANFVVGSGYTKADFSSISNVLGPKFGLILRYQNSNNYYLFYRQAGGNPRLRISKVVNGVETLLSNIRVKNPKRSQKFILEAVADGAELSMYLNGKKLANATDTSFSEGVVGIFISSKAKRQSHVIDNFYSSTSIAEVMAKNLFVEEEEEDIVGQAVIEIRSRLKGLWTSITGFFSV